MAPSLLLQTRKRRGRFDPLPFNSIYRLPESHERVGDRSNRYARLRQRYDQRFPRNDPRSLDAIQRVKQELGDHWKAVTITIRGDQVPYDIYNCPETPPQGYPLAWSLTTILQQWSPNDPDHRPEAIYQGLCVFDFATDHHKAVAYQQAELPFILQNDPQVARAVERWNTPSYLRELLADGLHRTEYSHNNHFLYHVPTATRRRRHGMGNSTATTRFSRRTIEWPENYTPSTELRNMTYDQWLQKASMQQQEQENYQPNTDHWYFRLIGCGAMGNRGDCDDFAPSEYLFDELPFFQPTNSTPYMVDPQEQKGIHCRFGMKGVIAENHFDATRNSIVLLTGQRRYLLAHPNQCPYLYLYPKSHPSARHSAVDWTNPDLEAFPDFAKAQGNEVVLQPGDVLYLPTHWFHYIVSLQQNAQCNTRSGAGPEYNEDLRQCGF